MGYQTIDVAAASTTALAVQFEDVANPGEISIKSLVKADSPIASGKSDLTSDQIWVFTGADWTKYFYYTSNPRNPALSKWVLVGDTTYTEIPDNVTIKPGQSFFFRRASGKGAKLTLAGGVVNLAGTLNYNVAASSTTAMAWPWPGAMKINDFDKYISDPIASGKSDLTSDQIWVFTGADWTKYFYYTSNPRNPALSKWVLVGDNKYEEIKDDVVVESGKGFFFRRASGKAATISFDRSK